MKNKLIIVLSLLALPAFVDAAPAPKSAPGWKSTGIYSTGTRIYDNGQTRVCRDAEKVVYLGNEEGYFFRLNLKNNNELDLKSAIKTDYSMFTGPCMINHGLVGAFPFCNNGDIESDAIKIFKDNQKIFETTKYPFGICEFPKEKRTEFFVDNEKLNIEATGLNQETRMAIMEKMQKCINPKWSLTGMIFGYEDKKECIKKLQVALSLSKHK